jgi:hypothetical protein
MNPITDNISFDNAMALIKAGDTAREGLHAAIHSVLSQTYQLKIKERLADWLVICPKYSPPPKGLFNRHGGDITWVEANDDKLTVYTHDQDSDGDPYTSEAIFPIIWLWDIEARRVGLNAEFDRLKAEHEAKAHAATQAKQDAERAEYERLKAQFESPAVQSQPNA